MDDTSTFTKAGTNSNESAFRSISIRGWLAIFITLTACLNITVIIVYLVITKAFDASVLANLIANFIAQWGTVLAFYYAQREKPASKAGGVS